MKMIGKLKIILVLFLMGWMGFAQAQEEAPTASWDPSKRSGSYTLDANFTLTQPVSLTGNLTITAGNGAHSIVRGWNDADSFDGMFMTNGYKLTITGTNNKKITINGNALYNTPGDARSGFKSGYKGHGIFVGNNGSIALTHVNIVNVYTNTALTYWVANDGGAIFFKNEGSARTSTLTNVIISGCHAVSGSAVKFSHTDNTDATFTNTNIYYCKTDPITTATGTGGTIRSNGSCRSRLTLKNCEIHHNRSLSGAGVFWNAGGTINTQLTIQDHTRIHDNVAEENGGGIQLDTKLVLTSCVIYNNTAKKGGGIYIEPYVSFNDHMEGYGVNLTVTSQDTIRNNTAADIGGGILLNIVQSEEVGFNQSGNPIANPTHIFDMQGGIIMGNQARQGAGVAILDNAAKRSIHNNVQSNEVIREVKIRGGQIYNNYSPLNGATVRGGGVYIVKHKNTSLNYAQLGGAGTVTLNATGGKIYNNHANNGRGGGMYIGNQFESTIDSHCNVNVSGSVEIYNNTSDGDGGGIFIDGGNFTMNGGVVGKLGYPNICTGGNGGGVAVLSGNINISDGNIKYNQAKKNSNDDGGNGGAFYLSNGTVIVNGGSISHNIADKSGGGLYLGNGSMTVSGGSSFTNNYCLSQGGGVYVGGGTFSMSGGAIGGTTADGNYTTDFKSYGGGLYMGGGTCTLTGGSISGNHTDDEGYGGAIYMDGGICTVKGGATIGGEPHYADPADPTDEDRFYTNTAKFGGGIYSANGTITVKGGSIGYNSAEKGGGIYANGEQAKVYVQKDSSKADELSIIEYNTAQYGGGIYGEKGRVEFSDGYIRYNTASEQGGGIYVDTRDTLYLKGSANMVLNGVPTGHKGGGVYLVGSIIVGEQTSPLGIILAQDNYAYSTTQPDTLLTSSGHVADSLRNNVYLPNPVVHTYTESTHAGVIEVVEDGISDLSYVGFSVPHGNVPVIYCTRSGDSWGYLHQFSTGQTLQYNLFDDSGRYKSVQYSNDPAFNPDHVYLYGFWSDEVTGNDDDYCDVDMDDFMGQDTIYISTPCQLAFFISWVNGRETPSHIDPHPAVCAKLMDDIDMSEFGWVPIGSEANAYRGVFDGNGHMVTGIRSLLNDYHTNYGFFGKLANNAVVKNLFIKGASFHIEKKSGYEGTMYIGGVAGLTSGDAIIENCESAATLFVEPENTNTVMGGLAGKTATGNQIRSSIGIADMTGFQMGGLVGQNGGDLLNSFANAKFTKAVNDHTQYMGGLVAVNMGRVENCYSRVRGTAPSTDYFGYLAGSNGDTLKYSYAREDVYVSTNGTAGSQTGIGTYGETKLPYLYKHRDTQVNATNDYVPTDTDADKQMMVVLNRWVDTINSKQSSINYTKWGRPWQVSDDLKPINADYPVLRMPLANAVASSLDDPYLDYNNIDVLLNNYRDANEAIWMYANDTLVQGENGGDDVSAKLYIDQDVALINANPLKAYVSITLDNSAGAQGMNPTYFPDQPDEIDWHMISTSLADAPIGINYSDSNTPYDFDWGHPDGMPYYRFYLKDDPKHGYFPSHRYGETYSSADNSPTVGGNYYNEWDFYSYYEPEFHWINFKRNSASHHHMEAEDHVTIDYHNGDTLGGGLGNESRLVPGKGYFAATREETLLQCYGTLNHEEVDYSVTRNGGLPRHGYNLLGNPYQAYLNFDAFADANSDDTDAIWDDVTTASYTILDEDEPDLTNTVYTITGTKPVYYRTYAYGCSSNPGVNADGFIHPHQGFFVRLEDRDTAAVYFYPDQRDASVTGKFRGESEKIDYPLVNLFSMEDNGNTDVVTVELGRPDKGGALLMQSLRTGNGKIWCSYEDKDYTIAFTQPGVTEVAIRFETVEDTEYTLSWNTLHGDFSYMHLIDNKTGADIDCLTTDHYKFSAKKTDYTSRFKLVFDYTGVEENGEDGSSTGSETFAFVMGDELVVTGEGMLQVFDVAGRMVMSRELHGVQSTMPMYNMSNGVYMLRLTNGKQSQVQKMVIRK